MNRKLLLLPLLAVVVTLPKKSHSQSEEGRRISIEITTTENGNTTTKSIDLENATEAEIEEAMRELGIMDHFVMEGDDENVVIDIRRFGPDGAAGDGVHMRMMPPMPPMPAMPPLPPAANVPQEKYTWLGVSTEKLTAEEIASKGLKVKAGVHVLEVMEGSPAEKAGLKKGDVITAVDGDEIHDPKMLSDKIRSHKPGDEVKITYHREGKKANVSVELAEREAHAFAYGFGDDHRWMHPYGEGGRHKWMERSKEPRAFLGVTPGEEAGNGASIGNVEEGSAAERIGLQEGDIIRSVNGEVVESFDQLSKKIRGMRPGDQVTLKVDRNGSEQELSGELGERKIEFHQWRMPENGDFEFNFEGFDQEERERLRQEMDRLRQEMEQLRQELGQELRSETRIRIESRKLTEEEKELLKNKGVQGLDNELQIPEMSTFPNPSNGFFRVQFDVPERGDLEVDVHDANGERVYQERITGFKGRYERTLDLSDKASGSYYLVVRQNGKATSRKLVKQ